MVKFRLSWSRISLFVPPVFPQILSRCPRGTQRYVSTLLTCSPLRPFLFSPVVALDFPLPATVVSTLETVGQLLFPPLSLLRLPFFSWSNSSLILPDLHGLRFNHPFRGSTGIQFHSSVSKSSGAISIVVGIILLSYASCQLLKG